MDNDCRKRKENVLPTCLGSNIPDDNRVTLG